MKEIFMNKWFLLFASFTFLLANKLAAQDGKLTIDWDATIATSKTTPTLHGNF